MIVFVGGMYNCMYDRCCRSYLSVYCWIGWYVCLSVCCCRDQPKAALEMLAQFMNRSSSSARLMDFSIDVSSEEESEPLMFAVA